MRRLFKFDFVELKVRKFQTLHFQQRIKRIILIYHAARRCISLMPQAATNGIEWLHSAFVFIRCTFRCIVHCINSSYSKYSLLKKASSETSIYLLFGSVFPQRIERIIRIFEPRRLLPFGLFCIRPSSPLATKNPYNPCNPL